MVDSLAYRIRVVYDTIRISQIEPELRRLLHTFKFKDWALPNYFYERDQFVIADIWVTHAAHQAIERRGQFHSIQKL